MGFRISVDIAKPTGQYYCLVKHFWERFFDLESIAAPQVEKDLLIFQTLAILILPGVLTTFSLFPKYGHYKWLPIAERDLATLDDKCFFLSLSMILIGFLAVFEWDALFPDRKDYMILTPFPVQMRTIFLAKISALSFYLLAFTAAIDLCPTILFPLDVLAKNSSPPEWIRYILSHGISVLLINLFIFLSALSVRGIILTVFPARYASRISRWMRFFCLLLLLCGLFAFPGVPPADRLIHGYGPLVVFYPPLWFLGIYEVLLGSHDPAVWSLAGRASVALLTAGALAALSYSACYRRFMSNSIDSPNATSSHRNPGETVWNRAFHKWLIRKPEIRATFYFVRQTIFRDPRHALYLASFIAVGIAIAAMSVVGVVYSSDPYIVLYQDITLLAIPLALSFFLIAGMRISFAVPVDLEANWLFRLAPRQGIKPSQSGLRKFLIAVVVLPFFVLVAVVYGLLWNWPMALQHSFYGLLLSLIVVEFLLSRFHKIPFTCSYLPGSSRFILMWPVYIFFFAFYGFGAAVFEMRLFAGTHRFAVFCIVAFIAWLSLLIRNASLSSHPLLFEEASQSDPTYLDLNK